MEKSEYGDTINVSCYDAVAVSEEWAIVTTKYDHGNANGRLVRYISYEIELLALITGKLKGFLCLFIL